MKEDEKLNTGRVKVALPCQISECVRVHLSWVITETSCDYQRIYPTP